MVNPKIVFTVISNRQINAADGFPMPLSKTFTFGNDGSLQKITAARLAQGAAERKTVESISEFAAVLSALQTHQALTYGLTDEPEAVIVTQKELSKHPNAIARDRQHFSFAHNPAVWFLDYDPPADAPLLTADQLRDQLIEACPALRHAPMLAQASSSSFIFNGDIPLKGAGGWHIYIGVQDGSDIPRAGKALYEHCWRIGTGYYAISGSGHLLERALIDQSVWQPERLDFSGAHCIAPLRQRRPTIKQWNSAAALFDTCQIIAPTPEEAIVIEQLRAKARAAVDQQHRDARIKWVNERKLAMEARGVESSVAQRTAEIAVDRGALLGEFELHLENGECKTVSEILLNREKYHGRRCADPLEPSYRDDNRIAYLNLFGGGRPYVYSHAHGGQRFELFPQARTLTIKRGGLTEHTYEVLELMKLCGDIYDMPTGETSRKMVLVRDGSILPLNEVNLRTYLGHLICCQRFDRRSNRLEPIDIPVDLVKAIFEEPLRDLPLLESVVSEAVMRADGSIIDSPGYYATDRLLFVSDNLLPAKVPLDPTEDQIRTAVKQLLRPFLDFPFQDDDGGKISRAVLLAALLTAVVRPTLPTSPAFLFEAPSAGTGKTLLAKCVAGLVTGKRADAETPPSTDEESRKSLFAALRCGQQVIIWDNLTQPVYGNSSLCAFITAPLYGDRVLGVSRKEKLPNKTMLLMTGNNPSVYGDACRRVLICRIDAAIERPSMREFDLEPETYVLDHRRELRTAALTILRAFQSRGAPKQTRDRAGSFETWDRVVRQCVIWLGRSGFSEVELGDPYTSALRNIELDPQAETLLKVMQSWRAMFGAEWKTASEVLAVVNGQGGLLCVQSADLPFTSPLSALAEAIRTIDPKGITAAGFGRWLQKHHDERVGGLRIAVQRDSHLNSSRYAVLETEKRTVLDPAIREVLKGMVGAATLANIEADPSLAELV